MKFTRLRIAGFKTFVDPTDFLIEPGLTAIVGPNGCGKSNLVEALRWVMGESSHKSLRGSGMDDVIFSGSGNRPARNTAEVVVTVDNAERLAPSAFNDADTLEISRRIEREAGSSYRINGRDVRARDVQLLFADASTGAHSPSMVRQGQIGELIGAKPKARRKILEEAAGIAGLHTRRHEAELRLRGAEQNLERLNDVLAEIESRLEALKKQARQAQRYRQMSAEIRKTEAILLHLRWREAGERIAERENILRQLGDRVAAESGEVAGLETERVKASEALPALRESETRAAAALRHLAITREGLDAERRRIETRQGELKGRIEQAKGDSEREARTVATVEETLRGLKAEAQDLIREIEGATTHGQALEASFREAEARLQTVEARLSELTREHAERRARRGQVERTIREEGERIARLEAQIRSVKADISALTSEGDTGNMIGALEAAVETARREAQAAEVAHGEKLHAQEQARDAETAAREPLREAEAELNALQAEQRTLAKLMGSGGELWPPVLEQVHAEAGFELALGAAIGDDLDHPADSAAPVFWSVAGEPQPDDAALPAGTQVLSAHVRAPAFLSRRLAQIGVVSSRAEGERLQPALKPGQRLVTRQGDLWRWDGLVAAADAPGAAAKRLEQRNRLETLEGLVTAAEKRRDQLSEGIAGAAGKVAEAGQAEAAAREDRRKAQSTLDQAQRALAEAQKAAARDTAKLSALTEAETRLNHSLSESRNAREEAEKALAAFGDESGAEREVEQQRGLVATARATYAESRAARDGHANALAARQRRAGEIARDSERWDSQRKAAAEQIATLVQRQETLTAELDSLADAPAELDARKAALTGEMEAAEARRKEAADILAVAETALAETERKLKAAEARAGETRELRAREEATLEGLRQRLADVAEAITETLECAPGDALRAAGVGEDETLPDTERLESKLDRLKGDRERLGGVNLRAEEEAREEQERFDALSGERQDLEQAVGRLRGAIQSLNREGRERLIAAFETVNGHFQALFTKLFGGGSAELQFTESDDPLEAGLEILARPPGKKPATLTLLSGGEQALTAIALIFAVFLTNPAPICVMDEVDAPLDDANVDRFCALLEEMARLTDTRFMVITHNPITMSRMNRLYGVTMAERGVSQLVSVDLVDAERLREAV
ncbi:MAG: chromosome segregation protein SMC [Rhodobiaceae bacterium]|nr:chromosome segregation protein SMC [Rhodobiaceae bacterium]